MAEVYRAYHANLDRFVAIKVLHAFLADDPEFKNRFEKEARNIAKLKHANIVQVYDFDYDEESESYYMVMELVEGPTLKERLFKLAEQGKLLPMAEAIRVVKQAAGALAYAHNQNMVHRDVKPGNLMLDHDERVVLTDFGIAKIVTGAQFTSTGGMVGTPAYMAPEQGLGEPGDERSDLYSLGVILFQLVTGRLPYDADTPLAVILKHLNEPVPSARMYRPELPAAIDDVVMRLMAKDPATRYQNGNELITALEQLEQTLDLSALASSPIPSFTPATGERAVTTPPVRTPTSRSTTPRPATATLSPTEAPTNPAPPMSPMAAALPAAPPRRRISWPLAALIVLALALGGYALAANQGLVPAIGLLPTATLTEAATSTPEPPTATLQPTEIAVLAPTEEVQPSSTDTDQPTFTPTATDTPTEAPTSTSLPTETPRPTDTSEPTTEPAIPATIAATRTPSTTPSLTPSATATTTATTTATASATLTRTSAPTRTPRPTATASASPTLTATPTASVIALLDVTQTLVQATRMVENRQATQRACDYAYRIIDQIPADGEFFPTNSAYVRDITLRNTGTCAWERNTSLNFVTGESFSAGPRIFLREPVEVGSEVILRFEGRTPIRGGNLTGTWELRTPDLIRIGEPIDITIFAYTR